MAKIDELVYKILCGHVLDVLKTFPDESIDCIVTSPPYWGLRDYGEETSVIWDGDENCEHEWEITTCTREEWGPGPNRVGNNPNPRSEGHHIKKKINSGFCYKCGAWLGQLGLEPTLELYISHLLQITAELKRVLKKTGVMFWNHGDSYGGSGNSKGHTPETSNLNRLTVGYGASKGNQQATKGYEKCMMMQNSRLVLKMVDEQSWILRNQIIWHKRNHLPSSVKDRLANAYEPVFMLVKNKRYYFDLDAIRVPHKEESIERKKRGVSETHKYADTPTMGGGEGLNKPRLNIKKRPFNYRVREAKKGKTGIVGVKSTEEEMNKYDRKGMKIPGQDPQGIHRKRHSGNYGDDGEYLVNPNGKNPGDVWTLATEPSPKRDKHYAAFPTRLVIPMIKAGCPPDGIVLDPFAGTGRALAVAQRVGRKWIGIDVSPNYVEVARRMTNQMTFDQVKEGLF